MSDAGKSQPPLEITGKGWRVAMPAMVVLNLATTVGAWVRPAADVSELRVQAQLQSLRDEQWRIQVNAKLEGFAQRLEAIEAASKNRSTALEIQVDRLEQDIKGLRNSRP